MTKHLQVNLRPDHSARLRELRARTRVPAARRRAFLVLFLLGCSSSTASKPNAEIQPTADSLVVTGPRDNVYWLVQQASGVDIVSLRQDGVLWALTIATDPPTVYFCEIDGDALVRPCWLSTGLACGEATYWGR